MSRTFLGESSISEKDARDLETHIQLHAMNFYWHFTPKKTSFRY
jgi:hypothetical protein